METLRTTKAKAAKAITRNAPKPPSKEPKGLTDDLERHSRDLGIPLIELRRICLRAGVDQLNIGELKVRSVNRVMVAVDLSKGFSPEEIESIDRAAKRQKITRDEFLASAIQKGIQTFSSEEVEVRPDKRTVEAAVYVETLVVLQKLANERGQSVESLVSDILTKATGTVEMTSEDFRQCAEMVRESEGKLPLMLPSWIVQRLADAGRVAEPENPDTAIAEAVLGDLAKSPAGVKDTVTEAFFLRAPKATAKKIDKLIGGWDAQPGDEKGGEG